MDDYLREVNRCLRDLPHASQPEKLKLIWKTTTRSVHAFMGTLPPETRDCYPDLCEALREEYSLYPDPAAATRSALAIVQKHNESPRDYYRRLRTAYSQGQNAPGLENDPMFKSLFLSNLHESVRYEVTMHCRANTLTMQEIRKYAQVAWETRRLYDRRCDGDARVLGIEAFETGDLALEGKELPRASVNATAVPQRQLPRSQGGQKQGQGLFHGHFPGQGPGYFHGHNQGYFPGPNQGRFRSRNQNQARQKQNASQPRRFEQSPKQGGKFNRKAADSPRGNESEEETELVRLLKAFVKQLESSGNKLESQILQGT